MSSQEDINIVQPTCWPWHQPFFEQIASLKQQSRLPHALLIETKSEQIDTSFIWQLVMLLLCKNSNETDPCMKCQSCELMLANTYPDFTLVAITHDEKSKKLNKNIKIEQIRKLIHEVYLTRRFDNLKIASIYPAEKMSIAGANSLLKTLEEPASHTLILLLTHNKGRIPITIRSRCQVITLEHPNSEVSKFWLSSQGMTEDESVKYLEYASGDPLLALQLQSSGYSAVVSEFKTQFSLYIKGEIDVIRLCSSLIALENSLIRRLIKMVLKAYSLQYSGLSQSSGNMRKIACQQLLALSVQVDQQLMVEDNNLNLQLQLEDVLISLKRIILRSTD